MNKQLHRYAIAMLTIGFLLIGCVQEDTMEETYHTEQCPLHILPTVGESFTRTSITNGSYKFDNQDAIGLFAVQSGELPSVTHKVYNQQYLYNGNSWNAQSDHVYWPNGELGMACLLYAYYPYTKEISDLQKHTFTVKSDQSTIETMYDNDFLYTKKPVNKENTPIILAMSHSFSMVTLNINYEEVGNICSGINIKAKRTANINLLNGEAVSNGNAEIIIPALLDNASDGYSQSYSAIIPPQKIDNSISFISLQVGGVSQNVCINRNFTAGKHYSINLTIAKDKSIILQGIYVSQWDEQVTLTNGSKNETVIYSTGDVITYQKKRDNSPVTVIVTGDGFLKEHMLKDGLFEQYATKAIDFIFDVEPFKTYRDYFNIYIIPAISNQAEIGNTSVSKDTYFHSYWDTKTDRLSGLNADILFRFMEDYCPDIKESKTDNKKTVTIVLVNDSKDDGVAGSYSDGKGFAMSTLPEGLLDMRGPNFDKAGIHIGDWRNIALHEFGHAFGRLDDEYWYETSTRVVITGGLSTSQSWPVPFARNVAADISETSYTCYWKHLIGDPRFPKVGYFEGAHVKEKGFWRSEETSCMLDNRRYFNAYSRQLIVERIMKICGEQFSFENFLAKDVNFDEVLDKKVGGANTRILKGDFSNTEVKKARPLSPPILIEEK